MKVYIAGKITGNENYKAEFAEAEEKLRELGHIPLNPAVLPEGLEKADYMRICLAMLDSADAIAPLLSWTRSDGAAIEMSLARYTDKNRSPCGGYRNKNQAAAGRGPAVAPGAAGHATSGGARRERSCRQKRTKDRRTYICTRARVLLLVLKGLTLRARRERTEKEWGAIT